jgi:hypothetical protein
MSGTADDGSSAGRLRLLRLPHPREIVSGARSVHTNSETTLMRGRTAGLCLTLFAVGGCTSKPASSVPRAAPQPSSAPSTQSTALPRGRANLISEAEITAVAGSNLNTAMQVIQRLRPAMLRFRSGASTGSDPSSVAASNDVIVYLDSQRMGGLQALGEIMLSQIREIRYLSPSDATTVFGTGHPAGAIQVVGRR